MICKHKNSITLSNAESSARTSYSHLRDMRYDLAKELSDAGLPQGGKGAWTYPPDSLLARSRNRVYVPTLSELVEACGDFNLKIRPHRAVASKLMKGNSQITKTEGDTPEEAVARLWLALNRKV